MPISDVTEQNAFLDNQYGGSHGDAAPSSYDLALFDGDPTDGGTELDSSTSPGYVRTAVPNDSDTWPDAEDGIKSCSVTLPAPTGAWDEATHWGLYNGDALGFYEAFNTPLDVTSAGDPPQVQISVYFGDSIVDS